MAAEQRRGVRLPARGDDSGFSLIEVVVAMVLFAGFAAALLTLLLASQAMGVSNRNRIAATNLAAREIDTVRSTFFASTTAAQDLVNQGAATNPDPLAGGTAGSALVVDGTAYTVVRTSVWNPVVGGASACDGGSLSANAAVLVTVTVTWPNMGSVEPVTNSALMSPGKGKGLSGTAAFAAVKVIDSAGAPNPGRGVKVVGANGDTRSGLTDDAGCAVVQLAPGTAGSQYRAVLTDTGYMDVLAGVTNPERALGLVLPGSLNTSAGSTPFTYDKPGHIVLTVVDANGDPADGATVAALGLTAQVRKTGPAGPNFDQPIALTGTSTTVAANLWPTTYAVDFNPAGLSPAPAPVATNVNPGATTTVTLQLPAAKVQVNGGPPALTSVVVVPAGAACDATSRRVNPTGFSVLPGTWDLYADGTGYTCSPGPTAIKVAAGDVQTVTWASTTLAVTGSSDPRVLRAVPAAAVTGPACPASAAQTTALVLTDARTGPQQIPAGSWYLYWANAAGVCQSLVGSGPVGAPYGQATTVTVTP
ncbi:MAG: prepilin-type N-terminal cleavage/methylation domain-containing protein [Actinobacteria bacterium]|nr:prepilin-type N-terminal cleavage/methylation domain-containing protein [Actinomycetota bacterium]MCG2802362.1 prepilin-type N-terminal cleavage/methylation domain-containing protein [Cellulomonas sp.]